MSKAGGETAADGDKKFSVSASHNNERTPKRLHIGIVRHKQKRNAESESRLQEDRAEVKD